MSLSTFFTALAMLAPAEADAAAQNRLNTYDHAFQVCKLVILVDSGFSRSIVMGTKGISSVCECSATLTVGSLTDAQILQMREPEVAAEFSRRMKENTASCIDTGH